MNAVLGLGTYRVRAVNEAARTALSAGAPWIDTAPNYAHGHAHRDLAAALAEYPGVRVATKTGFDPQGHHSLAPEFVRSQTEQSLAVLGRADLVFVHNPERSSHDRQQLHQNLLAAFAVLEEFAHAGRIGGYGVATWSGFTAQAFTVAELTALARDAAGSQDHHLAGLQMPVSLVMAEPITQALAGAGPLVHARDAGITTFASAPLHGGELPGLMTPELVNLIQPGSNPHAAAFHLVGACPALDVVLTSTSSRTHWDEAAAALAAPIPEDRLRKVLNVLSAG
ncbi:MULTISPECIES: aldo/keto reductase [unclassified Kitasatospora]|uniref:aldo/keto reductase n=1 Tax=unclassified Kitasatospora TaxID=2633591 RepID=UPI00070E4DBB|nr:MULTISPECIES: aldo/keto reductase [unclassified Kitasatospora]KQV20853.1 aldo/keto reductase [Kitasatospora sp. Root107]KRB60492.1 aldo/keto reductase [Kitasatospora sp. Root187]